jgi:hypothetical protein
VLTRLAEFARVLGAPGASTVRQRRNSGQDGGMKQGWTLSTCFEHFGAVRSRQHFGGSAISGDGATVVVAMWEDDLVQEHRQLTYQSRFAPTLKGKMHGVSQQWIAHLKWAIAHCDSRVRVVVLTAEDAQADPRVMRSCYPDDSLVMQITDFDTRTGVFRACTV